MFFFFFQAEDGIRDLIVTGVQTCALPIWRRAKVSVSDSRGTLYWSRRAGLTAAGRSEERRVGKECRSRRSPYHSKKKNKTSPGAPDRPKLINPPADEIRLQIEF